MKFNCLFK